MVGRRQPFCAYLTRILRTAFTDALASITTDKLYSAVNVAEPSLIRVESDEVTYNLHVMLRCEIERALINREIEVTDLPEVWNEKMRAYLGVMLPTHAEGVHQYVHVSCRLYCY